MYFDMGDEWTKIKDKYNLSDIEMFEYFNKPALDDAIANNMTIKFSHDPLVDLDTFLYAEWKYIKQILNLKDNNLLKIGEFWYVR